MRGCFFIVLLAWGCAKSPPNTQKTVEQFSNQAHAQPSIEQTKPTATSEEPKMTLEKASFDSMTGFNEDRLDKALVAFKRSCSVILKKSPDSNFGKISYSGRVEDWKKACTNALQIKHPRADASADFFREHFTPYLVKNNGAPKGRFTGYYEARLKGSLKKTKNFSHPIYKRPKNLVMVNMREFSNSPRPRRIAGSVVNGKLKPFFTRKEIDEGALAHKNLEIAWVDSPIDRLFAQIQGSAVLTLPSGQSIRLAYSAKNGRPYTAIGRELAQEGAFEKKDMSMQSIRSWLLDNPDKATEMMQRNQAYVFFKKETRKGAIGSQNVVLTPERSMAVDPYYIPLGAPLFLQTDLPPQDNKKTPTPFNRMMIAQDTGGAIRGPIRGDVFWGHGERAFEIAGKLKSTGSYFLLLPKEIVISDLTL